MGSKPYAVEIRPSALKALSKLPKADQRRAAVAIDALASEPRPHGCKALVGEKGLYRVRVGDWRIVYEIRDGELVVLVVSVGHRREVYR